MGVRPRSCPSRLRSWQSTGSSPDAILGGAHVRPPPPAQPPQGPSRSRTRVPPRRQRREPRSWRAKAPGTHRTQTSGLGCRRSAPRERAAPPRERAARALATKVAVFAHSPRLNFGGNDPRPAAPGPLPHRGPAGSASAPSPGAERGPGHPRGRAPRPGTQSPRPREAAGEAPALRPAASGGGQWDLPGGAAAPGPRPPRGGWGQMGADGDG